MYSLCSRFGNGFGADARRKRHTADSGYASEHPLVRRWSQDFSQDVSLSNNILYENMPVEISSRFTTIEFVFVLLCIDKYLDWFVH